MIALPVRVARREVRVCSSMEWGAESFCNVRLVKGRWHPRGLLLRILLILRRRTLGSCGRWRCGRGCLLGLRWSRAVGLRLSLACLVSTVAVPRVFGHVTWQLWGRRSLIVQWQIK